MTYDHTQPDVIRRARALQGRIQIFLPLISSLADPLIELIEKRGAHPEGLEALLQDVAKWVAQPVPKPTEPDDERPPEALRERIAAMRPSAEALASLDGALLANALWRLQQVVDVWQDIRPLRSAILHNACEWRPRFRHWRLGGTERFFDRGLMLFSTGIAVSAIIVACSLWIESG